MERIYTCIWVVAWRCGVGFFLWGVVCVFLSFEADTTNK